jgi:hypothetical protein
MSKNEAVLSGIPPQRCHLHQSFLHVFLEGCGQKLCGLLRVIRLQAMGYTLAALPSGTDRTPTAYLDGRSSCSFRHQTVEDFFVKRAHRHEMDLLAG